MTFRELRDILNLCDDDDENLDIELSLVREGINGEANYDDLDFNTDSGPFWHFDKI
jgi:hypothetical protein